ncbi:MAG: hypothetical protein ACREUW_15135 [Burkholderiales bacterium]
MKASIFRTLLAAALTSLAGVALRAYREHRERERRATAKAALQQWDTDGGGNPHHQYPAQNRAASRAPV